MGKKILIADDEPNIVVSLEFLMKQKGYEVKVAQNGEEALRAVGGVRAGPDPARRDDAADERLRPVPEGAREPGLAGHQDRHAVRQGARHRGDSKGIAVGADAYVTKPFSTKDLIAKVQELLGE